MSAFKESFRLSFLKVVISAILLALASWMIWTLSKPATPDKLFNKFFDPYVIQTTPRGLIEDSDMYMMGTIYYRDMEYDSAISRFEAQLLEEPDDYRAQLMLGISYMALKDFIEAENIFIRLVNDPNHLFHDRARWYLGLLYLTDKNEENDAKATVYLGEITDQDLSDKVRSLQKGS